MEEGESVCAGVTRIYVSICIGYYDFSLLTIDDEWRSLMQEWEGEEDY